MAFKMKGSTFYGKPTGNGTSTDGSIKVDRKMDKSSKPDGRAKSSAFQTKKKFPKGTVDVSTKSSQ